MQWSGQYYKYPITEEQILNRLNNTNPKFSINIFKIILEETSEMIGYKIDAIHKFEDNPKNDGYSMILKHPTKINT